MERRCSVKCQYALMTKYDIRIKRAYEPATDTDGMRILVDSMWPRGVSKDQLALDEWLKTVAPGTDLRKWFDHRPDRWQDFQEHYAAQLASGGQQEAFAKLDAYCRKGRVTLIYAARNEQNNHAAALKKLLLKE